MTIRGLLVAALATFIISCGAKPAGLDKGITRGPLADTTKSQHETLVAEGDAAWAKRNDRAQLELAIQKWDEAVTVKDDDYQTYGKLARACYLLADGWLAFDEGKPGYLETHERGFAYAERGLAALSPDFEKRIKAGTNIEEAVKVIGRNGVEHMYWYASNLGKWGNAKGFTTVLKYKDRIFGIVSRVHEVGPDFFYGASDRYFGAFYSIAPPFAGGDVQKSYEHFEASKTKAPYYLGTYNLIAEFYAPKAQNSQAFDEAIAFVLAAPLDAIPGLEPEAEIEKKKAAMLKERRSEFFDD